MTRGEMIHYYNYSLGSAALESGSLDPDPTAVPWSDGLQSNFAILLMSLRSAQREKTQTLQNDKDALNYTVTGIKRE